MTIFRKDEKWSPCLDENVFQFSGMSKADISGTWFL